jgi:hypothetical protein
MSDVFDDYTLLYKLAFAEVKPVFEQTKHAGIVGDFAGGIAKRVGKGVQGVGKGVEDVGHWAQAPRGPNLADQFAALKAEAPGFKARADAGAAERALATADTAALPRPQAPTQATRGNATQVTRADRPAPTADGTQAATPSAKAKAPPSSADEAAEGASDVAEEAAPKPRRNPLVTGGLMAGAGGGGYLYGQHEAEQEGLRNRNLAFGAGLATGTVAPQLVRRAGSLLSSIGGQGGYGYGPGGY